MSDRSDSRPSPLGDRIELVCKLRSTEDHTWNDRTWSLAAHLSEGYLATQRSRAADNPNHVLPEKRAKALADVMNINVEWLRYGKGSMERSEGPRQKLIESLATAIPALTAIGDSVAASIASTALAQLVGVVPAEATRAITPSAIRKAG